ncbi:hypothetical protein DFAR_3060042 [Desulfarculales bacterium]
MRLEKVEPSQREKVWLASENPHIRGLAMSYRCVNCGLLVTYGDRLGGVYADLDGKPFRDYYCGKCAEEVQCTTSKTTTV